MKIFMASFGVPFYWGGSTLFYLLSDLLRKKGLEIRHCVLEYSKYLGRNKKWLGSKWYDPYNFNSKLIVIKNNKHFFSDAMKYELNHFQPDILLTNESRGAQILRKCEMKKPLVLMIPMSSLGHVLSRRGVEAINILRWLQENPTKYNLSAYDPQRMAIACADFLISNSEQTHKLILSSCPECRNKIIGPIWTCFLSKPKSIRKIPFSKRKIDILMAAANWPDLAKNPLLMKRICHDLRKRFIIHIIGRVSEKHKVSGVKYWGLIKRDKLNYIMQDVKLMIIPSIYDSAPSILVEAIYAGCNILVSKNCGNSIFFPKNIIPDLSNLNEIYVLINKSLKKQTRLKLPYTQEDILSQLLIIFKKIAKNKP